MVSANYGRRSVNFKRLSDNIKAGRPPCWLCGQKINYKAKYPEADAFVVDHKKSWIGHPELREDPANLAAAHAKCNGVKGSGDAKPGLGNLSEEW